MNIDIAGWIDGILTDGVVQILNLFSMGLGVGLIFLGVNDLKKGKPDEKVWNVVAILVGAVMLGQNLLNLFGVW